ncbi:MAG: TlpA family protein disulfide reductase [Cyclobacteriaceae bacterium]|nr:TlpA family protein disulfide reductase [Cyclobacteriaceae bacterium]
MKKIAPVLLILLILIVYLTGFNRPQAVDNKEQDFNYTLTVKTLEGEIVPMESLKERVIFINLWATWCGPCRDEMPGIQKLYEKTKSDDIAFVMLSVDKESDQNKVVNYIKRNNFSFPVYMTNGKLTSQLNVPSIPTTFIIGKTGKIEHQKVGSTNYDTDKYIKLLNELAIK